MPGSRRLTTHAEYLSLGQEESEEGEEASVTHTHTHSCLAFDLLKRLSECDTRATKEEMSADPSAETDNVAYA